MTTASRARWTEQSYPSPDLFSEPEINTTALSQPVWFVDSVNGSDANDGSTPATAVQTMSEIARRFGKGNVLNPNNGSNSGPPNFFPNPPNVTINILNTTLHTDVPNFDVILAGSPFGGVQLRFVGAILSETPISSLIISSVVPKNRAANQPWEIHFDVPAGPFVTGNSGASSGPSSNWGPANQRIIDRSATQTNPFTGATFTTSCYFWGWKDGSFLPVPENDTLFVSEPLSLPNLQPGQISFIGNQLNFSNHCNITATDNFFVQLIPRINLGVLRIGGIRGQNARPVVSFVDLCLATTSPNTEAFSIINDGTTDWYYYGCSCPRSMDEDLEGRHIFFENCDLGTGASFPNGFVSGVSVNNNGANFQISANAMLDGGVLASSFIAGFPSAFYRFDLDNIWFDCTAGLFGPVFEFGTVGMFNAEPFSPTAGAINVATYTAAVLTLGDRTGAWGSAGPTFGTTTSLGDMWGGGPRGQNPGVGVSVQQGRRFGYRTPAPGTGTSGAAISISITGALGDFSLGNGMLSSWAPALLAPNVQGVTNGPAPAPIAVSTNASTPILNTWANLLVNPQPAGFGGVAWVPGLDSWILPT
jgi:hypothetical protein